MQQLGIKLGWTVSAVIFSYRGQKEPKYTRTRVKAKVVSLCVGKKFKT